MHVQFPERVEMEYRIGEAVRLWGLIYRLSNSMGKQ